MKIIHKLYVLGVVVSLNMKVNWLDAQQRKIHKDALNVYIKNKHLSGKELLATNTTYGKVYKLKDVVIVIHEESTDEDTDFTVIPKGWVLSVSNGNQ